MSKKVFSLGDTIVVGGIKCVAPEFRLDAAFEGWTVVFDTESGNEMQLSLSYIEQLVAPKPQFVMTRGGVEYTIS